MNNNYTSIFVVFLEMFIKRSALSYNEDKKSHLISLKGLNDYFLGSLVTFIRINP